MQQELQRLSEIRFYKLCVSYIGINRLPLLHNIIELLALLSGADVSALTRAVHRIVILDPYIKPLKTEQAYLYNKYSPLTIKEIRGILKCDTNLIYRAKETYKEHPPITKFNPDETDAIHLMMAEVQKFSNYY